MPAGRPLKFQSVEELSDKIADYFNNTSLELQSITGLAIYLDTSRETLREYQERPEFVDAIKAAKDKVEYAYELRGIKRGNAFDIFALKNFGWRDERSVEHSGEITQKQYVITRAEDTGKSLPTAPEPEKGS